ncbi:DUF438 domain-containing protein [Companilactobacillus ginsenosidimutans]|uniref:Histidine kinase n=1 Tax=Companilactobacillus ginsenosidimutans TaxID=1007676 RepID=A0A0H4QMA8_9LACO|nr:DUF438 domain-containing protein [Companilactobacillus ginsenosidimutans]AKP67843.1 histidine kinase [Companilactobacillus ginsenosidimutans]
MTNDTLNSVQRQKKIVEILNFLHEGGDFDVAKKMFDDSFSSVDVSEITSAERELIASGLNPMEIQNLCNVHAAVFKGSITGNSSTPAFEKPGHPVATMKLENMVISSLINDELLPCLKKWQQDGQNAKYLERMQNALKDLMTIDKHYSRKENNIFPLMDKYGITAPPKVMWGVDDEIRGWIKDAYDMVTSVPVPDKYKVEAAVEKACKEVMEMIFKEEEIMIPMLDEVATPEDWYMVEQDENDIGYTLIAEPLPWKPTDKEIAEGQKKDNSKVAKELNKMAQGLADSEGLKPADKKNKKKQIPIVDVTPSFHEEDVPEKHEGKMSKHDEIRNRAKHVKTGLEMPSDEVNISFNTGKLNLDELTAIFEIMPVDMTFVDANDRVKWFSNSPERVFPRTKAVIGRAVINCHPPKSVDKVMAILKDFHEGKSDQNEFWINLHGETFVYIRYYALRDDDGEYLGCLEVSQDVTHIRSLEGEKRLL